MSKNCSGWDEPEAKDSKKNTYSEGKCAHPAGFCEGYRRAERTEWKWSEKATATNLEEELGSDDFLKEESKLVMRKHDQHTRFVTQTLSETA